jgi:CobQ-like glutamine amidotransferase family enzyme
MPYTSSQSNLRGIGIVDIAQAIKGKQEARITGNLVCHVTEALLSFDRASESGDIYKMTTSCERPAPIAIGSSYN